MSKPGRGTVTTLSKAVLEFETSKKADRDRHRLNLERLSSDVVYCHDIHVDELVIRHRELRRVARRLAREATRAASLSDLTIQSHQAMKNVLINRIFRLENEIDRLNPVGQADLSEVVTGVAEPDWPTNEEIIAIGNRGRG